MVLIMRNKNYKQDIMHTEYGKSESRPLKNNNRRNPNKLTPSQRKALNVTQRGNKIQRFKEQAKRNR